MAREIYTGPDVPALTAYQTLIRDQIELRGDDNQLPTSRFEASRQVGSREYDYSYPRSGEINFGDLWQTHHLDVEDMQVVYAFKPPSRFHRIPLFPSEKESFSDPMAANGEVYVYEFLEQGGAKTRTSFTEYEGQIHKARVPLFASVVRLQPGGILDFVDHRRPLKEKETGLLETVLQAPDENVVALRGLVALNKSEERKATRKRENERKRQEEYQKQLEQISEAHIRPNIFIG